MIAGGCALALLFGAYLYFGDEGSRTPDASSSDVGPALTADLEPDVARMLEELEYGFVADRAYFYRFSRKVSARLGGQPMLDLGLEGELAAHVVESNAESIGVFVEVTFENITGVDMDGADAQEFVHTVFLEVDRRGRIRSMRVRDGGDPSADRQILRDLIACWLRELPDQNTAARLPEGEHSWLERVGDWFASARFGPFAVAGSDVQGRYEGELIVQGDVAFAETVELDLRKLRYAKNATPTTVRESRHALTWISSPGRPEDSEGRDELVTDTGSALIESIQEYRFEFSGEKPAAYTLDDVAAYSVVDGVNVVGGVNPNSAKLGLLLQDWEGLGPRLAALRPESSDEDKQKTFITLTDSVRAFPAMIPNIVTAGREYVENPADDRYQMIVGALSYSGYPEAQAGLIELYQMDNAAPASRTAVIDAFTLMTEPLSSSAYDFLKDRSRRAESEDERTRSELAIASSLRNDGEDSSQAARSREIRENIFERWRNVRTPAERLFVLDLVGNAGDPALLPIATEAFEVADREANGGELATAAVFSMRFMDVPEASRFLVDVLTSTRPAPLRSRATQALSYHGWDDRRFSSLERCVRDERYTALRTNCADILLNRPAFEQRTKALLREASATGDESFRQYVARMTAR